MCGRFALFVPDAQIRRWFEIAQAEEAPVAPRFNIAPTQFVPVVRIRSAAGTRQLDRLRWGLVPHWAENPAIGNRMINARSETVAVKPAFRQALRSRRCLIPASGFYEWRKAGGPKVPFFIRMRDGTPMALAGLWESWRGPDGVELQSTTILTTGPNLLMARIHDRMPVILPREAWAVWLDPATNVPDLLLPLLVPYPSVALDAVPVGPRVGSPANDDSSLVDPIGPPLL